MKPTSRTAALIALALGALATSCTYYDTPTTAAPAFTTGETITTLPDGYRTVTIQGTRYYTYGDRYYQPHEGGYTVVESPYRRTDVRIIRELPGDYRVVTHRGERFYRVGDVYYQQRQDGYVVVQSPY
jgi:hypothetical protein